MSYSVFRPFFVLWMLASATMLFLPLELHATTCTTIESGAWSTASVWLSGQKPQAGDTAVVSIGDSVWLDQSTHPLGALIVVGVLRFGTDTLFLQSGTSAFDTLIQVQGTLDADSGWFDVVGTVRPIVHVAAGGLFRTAGVFPYPSPSIFDSNNSPFFALDSASTFEYYSGDNTQIDVSYLIHNIFGHAYWNLKFTTMVAAFTANPLVVRGTLHIGFGASTITAYTPQTVVLMADVTNDNKGQSGAPGSGRTGGGMQSLGQDTWIFDATSRGTNVKDTIHWFGPSQMGTVDIRPNTVLSIRFMNDTVCDSLDILTDLIEEHAPCGGHFIGRAFSENPRSLSSSHPIDSFYGLGLTITSGTDPYLGLTRVVRTSGYLPPNSTEINASLSVLPVLRYYRITPGDGPQTGTPDAMSMQVHCDELNGTRPAQLHYWRSQDGGNSWAFSGRTSYDALEDVVNWDTTVLGWPNGYGSFLWMLADGYTDTPLPVVLQNFTAEWSGNNVNITWQTSSENNIVGFELDRVAENDTELLASYWSDDALRSRSQFGASYQYIDAPAPTGAPEYVLYEITDDGSRQWLGSRMASSADSTSQITLESAVYSSETLILTFNGSPQGMVSVADPIGRVWYQNSFQTANSEVLSIPLSLPAGFYLISYRGTGGEMTKKLLITP